MRAFAKYVMWLVLDGGWFQWLNLLLAISGVAFLAVAQFVISLFYFLCPFPDLLDRKFKQNPALQKLFSFRLQAPRSADMEDLVTREGYNLEHHVVETVDGFVLSLFRVTPKNKKPPTGPPILCMHGLMMCSDVWVVGGSHALPFLLCDAGYDVWLGNNRGNRYSCKHRTLEPHQEAFWNWSLDELARYDVPAFITHIQKTTAQNHVTYIGFSQGSAQGLTALTLSQELESSVPLFVALSPAVTVCGLSNAVASAIISSSPAFVFLLFGHRAMLASAPAWRGILSEQAFTRVIDYSLSILFNWKTKNISPKAKPQLYQHLYSPTSVKSVVHWFQIITSGKPGLTIYDDTFHLRSDHQRNFGRLKYDMQKSKVPCAVFFGKADTIIDGEALQKLLGERLVHVHVEESYEHLDFLWAKDVHERSFPALLSLLATRLSKSEGASKSDKDL